MQYYTKFFLPECSVVWSGESQSRFRRNILLPSSGRKVSQGRNEHETDKYIEKTVQPSKRSLTLALPASNMAQRTEFSLGTAART
jgi:hypothetical protein